MTSRSELKAAPNLHRYDRALLPTLLRDQVVTVLKCEAEPHVIADAIGIVEQAAAALQHSNRTASVEGDSEVVGIVRQTCRTVLGGNCSYADDDIKLLGHIACKAVDAGIDLALSDSRTIANIEEAKALRAADSVKSS